MRDTRYKIQGARGFTVVELMVALSLFAVIGSMAIGSVLTARHVAKRAQGAASAFDNMSFAMENVSRLIKVGTNYHCDALQGDVRVARDCTGSPVPPASSIVFLGADGMRYRFELVVGATGGYIQRSSCNAIATPTCLPDITAAVPITSTTEVDVQGLTFYVSGSRTAVGGESSANQAWVLVLARGQAFTTSGPVSFNLQTTLSQRKLEN